MGNACFVNAILQVQLCFFLNSSDVCPLVEYVQPHAPRCPFLLPQVVQLLPECSLRNLFQHVKQCNRYAHRAHRFLLLAC